MTIPENIPVPKDPGIYLMGLPPLSDDIGFLAMTWNMGEPGAMAEEWRRAKQVRGDLQTVEAGFADEPPVRTVGAHLEALRDRALADPFMRQAFQLAPASIEVLELDRLVVAQKLVNLRVVEELEEMLGPDPDEEAIFRFCLPMDYPTAPVQHIRGGNNVFVFTSPSKDFRPIESVLLAPSQISGYAASGPVAAIAGMTIGFSCNILGALKAGSRLILANGTHRACALRRRGVTHAPFVIQHLSHPDELKLVALAELSKDPGEYLGAPRPPVLKDYFDPRLSKQIEMPRTIRQVRVRIDVEVLDSPV